MVHASVDQHASVLRIHESLTPRPLAKRIPPETVAKAVVRGIERRAPRIFVPRIWTPLSVLRGGLNPLIDHALDRNAELHAVLRDVSSARTR
jgi:hypothetical protein